MRDLVAHAIGGRHLVDRSLDVAADRGRRVEQHDAICRGQKRRLVDAVGYPVEVPLDATDIVALVIQRRAERRLRDWCVIGQDASLGSCSIRGSHGAFSWCCGLRWLQATRSTILPCDLRFCLLCVALSRWLKQLSSALRWLANPAREPRC